MGVKTNMKKIKTHTLLGAAIFYSGAVHSQSYGYANAELQLSDYLNKISAVKQKMHDSIKEVSLFIDSLRHERELGVSPDGKTLDKARDILTQEKELKKAIAHLEEELRQDKKGLEIDQAMKNVGYLDEFQARRVSQNYDRRQNHHLPSDYNYFDINSSINSESDDYDNYDYDYQNQFNGEDDDDDFQATIDDVDLSTSDGFAKTGIDMSDALFGHIYRDEDDEIEQEIPSPWFQDGFMARSMNFGASLAQNSNSTEITVDFSDEEDKPSDGRRKAPSRDIGPNSTNKNNCLYFERWSEQFGMCVGCEYQGSMWNIIDETLRINGAHIADDVELLPMKLEKQEEINSGEFQLGSCDGKNANDYFGAGHICRIMCHKGYLPLNAGQGTKIFRCFCNPLTGCAWQYGGPAGDKILNCIDPNQQLSVLKDAAVVNPNAAKALEVFERKEKQSQNQAFRANKDSRLAAQRQSKAIEQMQKLNQFRNPIKLQYFFAYDLNMDRKFIQATETIVQLVVNTHISIISAVKISNDEVLSQVISNVIDRLNSLHVDHSWSAMVSRLSGVTGGRNPNL